MKTIDLTAIDEALGKMMAEFKLENYSRCIDLELWHHKGNRTEFTFRLTAFVNEVECEVASAPNWITAIGILRDKIHMILDGSDDDEIEVIVPDPKVVN